MLNIIDLFYTIPALLGFPVRSLVGVALRVEYRPHLSHPVRRQCRAMDGYSTRSYSNRERLSEV